MLGIEFIKGYLAGNDVTQPSLELHRRAWRGRHLAILAML
jgi:hypothetical protein